MSNTNFPNGIDNFVEKYNPTDSQGQLLQSKIATLENLKSKGSLTQEELYTYKSILAELSRLTFSATDYNKICECIVAIEYYVRSQRFKRTDVLTSFSKIQSDTSSIPTNLFNDGESVVYNANTDTLIVDVEGTRLVSGEDYTMSKDGLCIVRSNGGLFYANENMPLVVNFILFRETIENSSDYNNAGTFNNVYLVDDVNELSRLNAVNGDIAIVQNEEE